MNRTIRVRGGDNDIYLFLICLSNNHLIISRLIKQCTSRTVEQSENRQSQKRPFFLLRLFPPFFLPIIFTFVSSAFCCWTVIGIFLLLQIRAFVSMQRSSTTWGQRRPDARIVSRDLAREDWKDVCVYIAGGEGEGELGLGLLGLW